MDYQDFWKCEIPDGEIGEARLETFTVNATEAAFSRLRRVNVNAGTYKRLFVGGELVMSDTNKEYRDHLSFFNNAEGHVLINGLGMGCCLRVVQNCPDVDSITVIEKSQDVISLIGTHFPDVTIIHADAMEWKPPVGSRFGAVWHDIWPDICLDNLPAMHKLHRRFGRKSCWQGSWSRNELEYIRSQNCIVY